MRLVGRPLDVYQYLEPLYNDYRKVRPSCSAAACLSSLLESHPWEGRRATSIKPLTSLVLPCPG